MASNPSNVQQSKRRVLTLYWAAIGNSSTACVDGVIKISKSLTLIGLFVPNQWSLHKDLIRLDTDVSKLQHKQNTVRMSTPDLRTPASWWNRGRLFSGAAQILSSEILSCLDFVCKSGCETRKGRHETFEDVQFFFCVKMDLHKILITVMMFQWINK